MTITATRRTALKAIAAALMAPTVRLRKEIDREALMRPFCGDDWRYSVSEPFKQGSLTYCTDARRIIRGELAAPEIVGERRLPDAVGLWGKFWQPQQWIEVDRPQIGELLVSRGDDREGICPVCFGRRISLGDTFPDLSDPAEDVRMHRLDCDIDDNTIRDASCTHCRGLDYYGPWQLEIGGHRFAYNMIAAVFDLPGVKFHMPEVEGRPLLFCAEGFEGMVMPLRGES